MNPEEAYQAELKQSEIDHYTPTAGAMVGHIIANLLIHSLKISQAKFFTKGNAGLFLDQYAPKWIEYERMEFNKLNQILVNNGESIPTTTDQFKEYTMLKENGATKYEKGNNQLFTLVKDFDTQILFITKAITLAQNEDWPELSANLVELLSWIKKQIRQSQNFLNHDLREGLYTEKDDDNDDF